MQSKTERTLILAVETATRAGGVAVARGENILAAAHGEASVSHSTNLIEMIDGALRTAGCALTEVELFAVAVGPGSFTGLRIGLATVKAFAVHLRSQVVAVPTLAALAHASGMTGNIIALLPAGRGEVFAQRYEVVNGSVSSIDQPRHLSPEAVIERYSGIDGLQWTGEGTRMLAERFGNAPPASAPIEIAPSIAVLAYRAQREGKTESPEDLQAVYVRASDAEINEQWQLQKRQQPAQS